MSRLRSALEQDSSNRAIILASVALFTALLTAVTSLVLTSRLSNEDALLADMDVIITSSADQAVANTESFLAPAVSTADFLGALLRDGLLDPSQPEAETLLLDVIAANEVFDGAFVGTVDGEFIYASRLSDDIEAVYATKLITTRDGTRIVENGVYDRDVQELSRERDDADAFDPRTRVWFDAAVDSSDGAWTDPYIFFTSGRPGVTRSSPVRINGELEYVVGVDIRLEELSNFMAERAPSDNGSAFIMTKSQQMVAYPVLGAIDGGTELLLADDVEDPAINLAGATVAQLFVDAPPVDTSATFNESPRLNGEDTQFVYNVLETNSDWVVGTWAPNSDFLAEVRRTQQTNTWIAFVTGAVILIALLLAVLWVLRLLVRSETKLVESQALTEQSSTERNRVEIELAHTVAELEASNRGLEEYAFAAAHDLRTPLRAIGGYSELIGREAAEEAPDIEQIRRWADRIVLGYDRMGHTMDNLLEHARMANVQIDLREIEEVDTQPIVAAVVSDLAQDLLEVDGTISVGDLPHARIDPAQLSRVFQNLIENAIRFRHADRPLLITIAGGRNDERARFCVIDNGIGIAGPERSRIFESFNHSRESSGVGLGLSLVKRIVQDYGGDIRAESDVGRGSRFEFTLPYSGQAAMIHDSS